MDWEQERRENALKSWEDYRAGRVSPSSYSSMIVQWGKAGLLAARADIEPFLYNPDPSVRSNALQALTFYFRLQDYWHTAVQFLLYDAEYIPRFMGASALAWLRDKTGDQQTLGVLVSVVRDHYEDEILRKDSLQAMYTVAYGYHQSRNYWEERDDPPEKIFDLEKDADWKFIESSVDPELEEQWRVEAHRLLQQYREGKVSEQDYYAMLRKFARSQIQEARAVIESFLTSSSILLRTTAFRALVLYLRIPDGYQMAVDAVLHDPDSEYRQEAVEVLGLLMQGTKDKATMLLLDQFFMDDELGMDAISAIQTIYGGDYGDARAFLETP